MDAFNEELFLAKEWLVKVDAQTSTPYLFKFHSSPVDLTCSIMITDTKRTWAEVLSGNQFARRWRECNERVNSLPLDDDDEEEAWRTRSLELLSRTHTLGGMSEVSFEVVQSKFGDFAFRLECNAFKWRWETIFVGHRVSADVLSRHLIMPLITANHLAFSSSDAVGDLPPTDLDKAIDKAARTARRTVDTHVKNALSKPRLATTIRRITAVFNFISDPPNISSEVDSPVLLPPGPVPKIKGTLQSLEANQSFAPELDVVGDASASSKRDSAARSLRPSPSINRAADSGSATESEDDPLLVAQPSQPISGPASGTDRQPDIPMRSPTPPAPPSSAKAPPHQGSARSRSDTQAPASDTDSSPVRPIKKAKARALSSDDEEDEEVRKKPPTAQAQRKTAGSTSAPGRGVRQPVKRGGKRF